jgi:DNA-binding NtrC family response regulator
VDPKKRVLIVDDEPNVRLMLLTALESVGYDVFAAENGCAALEHLRHTSSGCDLILLDLKMPKMDGMEVLRRLREEKIVVPVIILTAHGSIPDAVQSMKLGAIDFLTKPITPDALRRVVAEVIERQALPGDAARPAETSPRPSDRSRQVAFDLARAKRSLNRGQFSEAESLLRGIIGVDPGSVEAPELLDRLQALKDHEARGSYRILRDWFPSGKMRGKS